MAGLMATAQAHGASGRRAALDEALEFVAGVEALHLALRVGQVIPQDDLVAVGGDRRPSPVHRLQRVGVEAGLLAADLTVDGGALHLSGLPSGRPSSHRT